MIKKHPSLAVFSLCILATVLTACGGDDDDKNDSPPPPGPTRVQQFITILNNKASNDGTFYIAKENTATSGFILVKTGAAGPSTGTFVAYDIKDYVAGESWESYAAKAEFLPVNIDDITYKPLTNEYFYSGSAYQNNSSHTYAGDFVFEETASASKDLEKIKGINEAYRIDNVANLLVSEYGLSEERSLKVAKMANNMGKVIKNRSLTEADANSFSKELLGVSLVAAEKAFRARAEGDDTAALELIESAAKTNQTSPENINQIMEQMLSNNH